MDIEMKVPLLDADRSKPSAPIEADRIVPVRLRLEEEPVIAPICCLAQKALKNSGAYTLPAIASLNPHSDNATRILALRNKCSSSDQIKSAEGDKKQALLVAQGYVVQITIPRGIQ